MAISKETLRLARKGGFKKKAPKKPKKYTETQMINYLEKYKQWSKECMDYAKKGKKLDNLAKQVHATRHYR
tara:strand:+ start:229 stop:441 length:213 start_codon:yes stop_codon:yes gene_type:complete